MAGMMDGIIAKLNTPIDVKSSTSITLLWVYAVFLQFLFAFQLFFEYGINPTTNFVTSMILYLALSVWAFFTFKDSGILSAHDLRKLFQFLAISALYIFIPSYTYLLPKAQFLGGPSLSSWFQFLFYVVFPLWPLYIANHSDGDTIKKYTHYFVNFWVVAIIFVFIFFLASNINSSKLAEAGGRPEIIGGADAFQFLIEKIKETGHNFWSSINFATNIKVLVNSTGLAYYTGTVDENEKAPVGIYISNVRPADKYFFVDSPVTVWADIKGKSFNEPIKAIPICFIDKHPDWRPVFSPSEFIFFGEDQNTLSCTFESLPKGSHSVHVGASFDFETWAYVTYTFVDQELDRAMQVQGKNINSELNIPNLPEAVFTNGPVLLGMGAQIDMPVTIDVSKNNRDAIVGITVDNRWSDGKISATKSFELGIPDDFQLKDCDKWYPLTQKDPTSTKDGYNFYTFEKADLKDDRALFSSVTCRVHVKDPAKFLAGSQKVQRTFLSKVKYSYEVTKTTSVVVKE